MTCRWQVEVDPYCLAVLRKHWPDGPKYGDIRTLTGYELEPVDLVCGGFPCQPVSLAGRRRGTADERWLWPEFARLLRVLRPRFALLENVPGLFAGGGMAEVLGDLAALGFDAEWDCIPAAAVGAPHLRYRVFIVAYADGRRRRQCDSAERPISEPHSNGAAMADAERRRWIGSGFFSGLGLAERSGWPAEPDVGRVAHGIPSRVDRL